MGGEGEVIKIADDGYDELDGIFGGKAEIPGDEVTGEVDTDDVGGDGDDSSNTDNNSSNSDDSTNVSDSGTEGAADEGGKKDSGGNTNTEETGTADTAEKDKDTDNLSGSTEGSGGDNAGDGEDKLPDNETELRAMLREQQRTLALTEAKLDTFARQQKADKDAEESDEAADTVDLSVIETHQGKLNEIAETRGEIVLDMLELMKVNPTYADVETVCSKNNLDDTLEVLAKTQVAKDGGDLVETMMGLEVDIWSQRNPYSYMYGLIKKVLPQYTKAKGKEDTGDGKDEQDTSKDKKKKAPAKAPLSAVDLSRGGGDKNIGEWTAEKIDNLSESSLTKVPKDVYDAYMRGDLDK